MKEILKPAFRLFVIAVIAAALLGGTYLLTKDPIAEHETAAQTAARQAVLADAVEFREHVVERAEGYEFINEVYDGFNESGELVGYTISMTAKGYNPDIVLTLGVDHEGVVTALNVGSNSESPGLGANAAKPEFYGQFAGKTAGMSVTKGVPAENEISAISGATVTSRGITDAVSGALEFFAEYIIAG